MRHSNLLSRFTQTCILAYGGLLSFSQASAQALELESTENITRIWNVYFSTFDNRLYYSVRNGRYGSAHRFEADGSVTDVLAYTNLYSSTPSDIKTDPNNGDIFISQDYGGNILRYSNDLSENEIWIDQLGGGGDDDPSSILIVPDYYLGNKCDEFKCSSSRRWRDRHTRCRVRLLFHSF